MPSTVSSKGKKTTGERSHQGAAGVKRKTTYVLTTLFAPPASIRYLRHCEVRYSDRREGLQEICSSTGRSLYCSVRFDGLECDCLRQEVFVEAVSVTQ